GWLAHFGRRLGARLIHLSTDYVFDGMQAGGPRPYHEGDEARPLSVYGKSKRKGELAVLDEDVSACVAPTSWLFSEHGNNFVTALVQRAMTQQPLRVITDQ